MRGILRIYKDPEVLALHVADQLMELIAQSHGEKFNMAISGGSTPNLLFSTLAKKYADSVLWEKTHFWWVDERMVPARDPESNFGTAQKLLFSLIEIPEDNIHIIHGEENPQQESENYARQIQEELPVNEGWPLFDLILLGMGEDGHTASIFPDHIELMQSTQVCEVAHHPLTNQARISLTGIVLNNATRVWFLVTGAEKAGRLAEINSGSEKSSLYPASCINPVHGELSWFLDKQAARLLL